jgi:chemotaxis protein MotB
MKFNAWSLALALIALASCTNSRYTQALNDRDAEIKALREERTAVKNQNRDLNSYTASLDRQLAEANARLLAEPVRTTGQDFPDLDREGVAYGMRDGNLVISVSSDVTFASGKAELSAKGKEALAAVVRTLKATYADDEYWIEGHTDSDPIQKSKFESNRALSIARGMAVLHYMVEDAGIPDGQCVVAGWGEYRPVSGNDTKTNKAKNRRVEIVVHAK